MGCIAFSCFAQAFSSCHVRGLLFIASHCCDFSCCRVQIIDSQASVCGSQALELRLNSCGTRAYLLCGLWDLPTPGIEPKLPLLAGKFLSTMPPGKSPLSFPGSLCTNNQNRFLKNTLNASCSAFLLTTICLRVKVKWPQLLRSHLPPLLSAHSTPPTLALCCFSEVKHILASGFFHLFFSWLPSSSALLYFYHLIVLYILLAYF